MGTSNGHGTMQNQLAIKCINDNKSNIDSILKYTKFLQNLKRESYANNHHYQNNRLKQDNIKHQKQDCVSKALDLYVK